MQLKQSRCICKYVGTLSSALDASYLSGLMRGTRHCDQLYKLRISSKWPVSLLLAPQSEQLCNVVKRSSVLPCSLGEQREPSVWHFLLQAGNDFYDASTWLWDSHCECTPHPTYALYLHISSSSSPLPMQPSQFWPITSPLPAIHFHHHHDYDRQHCHDHDHHQHCQRSHHHFDQQSITSCLPRVPATNQLFIRKYTNCKDKLLFIVQNPRQLIFFSVDCRKINFVHALYGGI